MALDVNKRNPRHFESNVSMEMIAAWREACATSHGTCCNVRYTDQLAKRLDKLYLVDVNRGAVSILPSTTRYVALSYVWGQVPMLKMTIANLDDLQNEGAVFGTFQGLQIPRTIRDAIKLTKSLGERYLWVDCLCVIQDNETIETNRILRAMAYIYACAELTIVAACGTNADHGIEGIDGPSLLRTPVPKYKTGAMSAAGYPDDSEWAQRGWTFQESLFARRLLVFGFNVSWLCGLCTQTELFEDEVHQVSLHPSERPHLGVPMGLMSLIPKVPSLGRWGMLIENYSSRTLTFENDSVAAFAGATEIMKDTFPGGIVHGLPIYLFDIALLWQPRTEAYRRFDQPSWSWTGWNGTVDCLRSWTPFHAGIYRSTGSSEDYFTIAPLEKIATYRFHTLSRKLAPELDALNRFYKYQAIRNDGSRRLPSGWKTTNGNESYVYSGDSRSHRRYAHPHPDVATFPPVDGNTFSTVVRVTAPSVQCTLGPIGHGYRSGVLSAMWVQNGKVAVLFLTPSFDFLELDSGTRCHLIAISKAVATNTNSLWEWLSSHLDFFQHDGIPAWVSNFMIFYNVLWVRWENGIAYRVALGMIDEKSWNALEAQVTETLLG